jgi:hypothetical protein
MVVLLEGKEDTIKGENSIFNDEREERERQNDV